MPARRIILTGAPGTGKTAVLAAVDPAIARVGEPAREILAEHPGVDQTPQDFVAKLLERSVRKWEEAAPGDGPALFDRGVPDCAAYARYSGVDHRAADAAAQRYRYHPEVLLLEPWEAIYTTDGERTMTFDMTVDFHAAVLEAFEAAAYTLVPVPQASIGERAAFVGAFVTA